jgi:hypothetical protein
MVEIVRVHGAFHGLWGRVEDGHRARDREACLGAAATAAAVAVTSEER